MTPSSGKNMIGGKIRQSFALKSFSKVLWIRQSFPRQNFVIIIFPKFYPARILRYMVIRLPVFMYALFCKSFPQ